MSRDIDRNEPGGFARLEEGSSLGGLAVFKACVGTLLIVIGVVLAFYVASVVFGLVAGDEPPGMVKNFAQAGLDQVADAAGANPAGANPAGAVGPQRLEIAPDILRTLLHILTFFLLILPTTLAAGMIRWGASLMHGEAMDLVNEMVKRLRKS